MNAQHPDRWIVSQLAMQLFVNGQGACGFEEAVEEAVKVLAVVDARLPPWEPSGEELEIRDMLRTFLKHFPPKDVNDGL